MKDFLFFLGILWVILLLPGTSADPTGEDSSSELPYVIYPMQERTNKNDITCNNSNKDNTMNLRRGVKCLSDDRAIEVIVPLLHKSCRSPAKKLTITVNREDDVVIEFRKLLNLTQMSWRQDPKEPCEKINTTDESKLIVPLDKTKESGVYLFEMDNNQPGASRECAVVINRRECPANRYGDQCSHWCPDCMHGGICDAKTGKCVCPPGFRGELCEEACAGVRILNSCTENPGVTSNRQICLPPPYGCSCAPGKKGYLCDEGCDPGTWGVNCLQRCNHCVGGTCNTVTGKCSSGPEDPCAGGPKGYLRFRQEPDVEPDEDQVTVSFVKEFDGEEPISNDITYRVVIWEKDQSMNYMTTSKEVKDSIGAAKMSVEIQDLAPATNYYAAVLVKFSLNDKVCEIDGTLRGERIQKKLFTTICPKWGISSVTYHWESKCFDVSWKEEAYANRCNNTYEVKVERVSDGKEIYNNISKNPSHSQDELEPDTDYKVSIAVVYSGEKSDPYTIRIKTLPKPPTTPPSPIRFFEDSGSVTYKWNRPSDVEGNISYKYTYEVKPIACGEETEIPADKETEATEVSFPKPLPYARVTFRIAIGNEAGFSQYEEKYHETDPEVPAIKVEKIDCGDYKSLKQCSVTLENDCRKNNGRDLDIEAVWEYKTNSARDPKSGDISAVYFTAQNLHNYIIELPRDLYHHTTYQLAVYVKNEAGRNESSRRLSEKIITPPVAPGKVKITRIVSSHSSLDSGWDPKLSFPPTGDINGYVIDLGWDPLPSFPPTGNINGYVIEVYETRPRRFIGGFVVADESCVISYLDPDVSYTIHVSGINEGVPQPGEAAIIVISTLAYKPSQPINFLQDSSLSCNAQWDDENIPLSEDLIFQNEDYSISEKEHKEQCD
ncbi:tyrosine-protein kinase receptor Tie-1-like [Palaemon carinicauda]|uniref:tyrosine-protein kinase receptor Tie-1-like n=1 Tax=Palaemon carinicauda TaxID=392227 RepID=UPI0035B5F134